MDDALDFRAVCDAFGLGRFVDASAVPRALSNLVFRVRTDLGLFAVKQMTPAWPDTDWDGWLREAFTFEIAAFDAGVPMPRPLTARSGDVLAAVPYGDVTAQVRVHEWVSAEPWRGPVSTELAAWVGKQLGVLHGLALQPETHAPFPQQDGAAARSWPALVERVRDPDLRHRCRALSPYVEHALSWFRPDDVGAVMSHGDLDPKNLMVSAQAPMICDWDVAAPWIPRQELARVCFDLAYWDRGIEPDWELARGITQGYREASGDVPELTPADAALHLLISLDWLTLQIERAADLRAEDSRRDAAVAAVPGLLAQLQHQIEAAETIGRLTDPR